MGHRLLHWGPVLALSVTAIISWSSSVCLLEWWPVTSTAAVLNLVVFILWHVLILYNFFLAVFVGPGFVPHSWKPVVDGEERYLQYCTVCQSYKAPRSHHCRKCQRCVMKMDHHCPWINNCVGHFNHAYFTCFLFFTPCGCIHALCMLIPALYRAVYRNYYIFYGTGREPLVSLGFMAMLSCMVAIGLAIGVTIAVGGLFFIQLRSIVRNETGIESWIKEKAEYREREEYEPDFVFPYNLGWWRNICMVLHWKRRPELDGITWPVRDSCHQYTLTIEQMEQKKEKRQRSIVFAVNRPFSGAMCPLSHGARVCCCPPCIDEQRLKLQLGDQVLVSRIRKHWLYGEFLSTENCSNSAGKHQRGWFPRQCASKVKQQQCDNGNVSNIDSDDEPCNKKED